MGIIEDILKDTGPLLEANIKVQMYLAAKIDDGIKANGWTVDEFHRQCNKQFSKGESNYGPRRIRRWLGGAHDFKASELIIIGKVFGEDFFKYASEITKI